MLNEVNKMIEAGRKVAEINQSLLVRYEIRGNNEFLAAIDALVIESLHSEMLGHPEKIREYKLSLRDVSKYCWDAGKIGMLASIYVQVEVGQDDGFTADNEIVEDFRKIAKLGDMTWADFFQVVSLRDHESIVWFADYLYQLGKVSSQTMMCLGQRIVNSEIFDKKVPDKELIETNEEVQNAK